MENIFSRPKEKTGNDWDVQFNMCSRASSRSGGGKRVPGQNGQGHCDIRQSEAAREGEQSRKKRGVGEKKKRGGKLSTGVSRVSEGTRKVKGENLKEEICPGGAIIKRNEQKGGGAGHPNTAVG